MREWETFASIRIRRVGSFSDRETGNEVASLFGERFRQMVKDIGKATSCDIRQICASFSVPRSSFYHAAEPTATY